MGKEQDRQAFLAAIESNPLDYSNRLIYADWLEEHDEPEEADRQRRYEESEKWLKDFANKLGSSATNYGYDDDAWQEITYEMLIQAGHDFIRSGDYFVQVGSETARDLMYEGDNRKKFWEHWEVVTGVKVSDDDRGTVFSCSC